METLPKDIKKYLTKFVSHKDKNSLCQVDKFFNQLLRNEISWVEICRFKTFTEKFQINIRNQKHGEYKSYYGNGKLECKCFYKNGNKDGEYRDYHEDGQLDNHWFFKNGKYYGEWKEISYLPFLDSLFSIK